jgi:autotransporter translocation and assembly factor TamB
VPSISGAPGQATPSASGPASGFGTTPLGPTGNAGTALNAGKYVASGVYVGVSQGADASSSTVTVEVEVAKHVTVTTEAGTSSGTGIGLNWKLDY